MIWRLFADAFVGLLGRRVEAKPHGTQGPVRRLLVDVSIIIRHDAHTGIQRVIRNVWQQLHHLSMEDVQILPVFATRSDSYRHAIAELLPDGRVRFRAGPQICEAGRGDIFLGLDFAVSILPRQARQLWRWKRAGTVMAFLVYDLLPLSNPEWFTRPMQRNFRRWVRCVSELADIAFCISDDTKARLGQVLRDFASHRVSPVMIHRVHLGSDFDERREMNDREYPPIPHDEHSPFVLMVGTVEPRKNYGFALDVLDRLGRSPHQLPIFVIVGRPGWKSEQVQARLRSHTLSGHSLIWLDNADDAQLRWLYRHCALLFCASQAEGFGLPIAEARQYGARILATDIAVFREFGEDGIWFFRSDDVADAAARIAQLISEPSQEVDRKSLSLPLWRDTAREIATALSLEPRREPALSSA